MFQLSDDESPNSPKTNLDEKTLFSKPRPIQISSSLKHPAQPSPGASSIGSTSSETASHFKYPTSLGYLDPVAEIAESPEAFIGSVISQLRDMRKGANGNEWSASFNFFISIHSSAFECLSFFSAFFSDVGSIELVAYITDYLIKHKW